MPPLVRSESSRHSVGQRIGRDIRGRVRTAVLQGRRAAGQTRIGAQVKGAGGAVVSDEAFGRDWIRGIVDIGQHVDEHIAEAAEHIGRRTRFIEHGLVGATVASEDVVIDRGVEIVDRSAHARIDDAVDDVDRVKRRAAGLRVSRGNGFLDVIFAVGETAGDVAVGEGVRAGRAIGHLGADQCVATRIEDAVAVVAIEVDRHAAQRCVSAVETSAGRVVVLDARDGRVGGHQAAFFALFECQDPPPRSASRGRLLQIGRFPAAAGTKQLMDTKVSLTNHGASPKHQQKQNRVKQSAEYLSRLIADGDRRCAALEHGPRRPRRHEGRRRTVQAQRQPTGSGVVGTKSAQRSSQGVVPWGGEPAANAARLCVLRERSP